MSFVYSCTPRRAPVFEVARKTKLLNLPPGVRVTTAVGLPLGGALGRLGAGAPTADPAPLSLVSKVFVPRAQLIRHFGLDLRHAI